MNTKFIKYIPEDIFNDVIKHLIEIIPYDYLGDNVPPKQFANNTYKYFFGSWLKTLVFSELLEGNIRETPRGTMCIAKDGTECLSIAEKQICDWFYHKKIRYIKEPKYPKDEKLNPNGLMRADWKVGKILIEYFGLKGNNEYDIKIQKKIELCKKYNISLIELYQDDLIKLDRKLDILKNAKNNKD